MIDPPGVDVKININGREYLYVTQQGDTLATARDRIVSLINNANNGQGDPQVVAVPGQQGFFSARADVEFGGTIRAGDTVSILVRDRTYSYTVVENDTLVIVRNILVQRINLGPNLDGTRRSGSHRAAHRRSWRGHAADCGSRSGYLRELDSLRGSGRP